MRSPESKIKESILHPEEEVRLTALAYFAGSHTADAGLMPMVIEAVEKYGRNKAFRILRDADGLPQAEATIRWLSDELSKDWDLGDLARDNYCFAVALILCEARTDLLRPEMSDLRCFPEELRGCLRERLEMASWDWDAGWAALEELGREVREQREYRIRDVRRGRRIIESLARHREKGGEILPLLHRRYRGRDRNLMEWLECFNVELAGRMHLEEAVPVLVERLHEDDFNVSDACLTALKSIGTDTVVETIAEQWQEGKTDFRRSAAEVMEHIHTDLSAEKCLQFFHAEQDQSAKNFLANALLGHFVFEAVEPIRQMVAGRDEDLTPDDKDLKSRLVAACTVMGTTFPGYEDWYTKAVENAWGWLGVDRPRIRETFREDAEEEEFDEDEWEDDLAVGYFEEESFLDEPGVLPVSSERPPMGRNDPCPCGSGKKYKKCCMKKEHESLETLSSKFPVGTVALYGPDDKRTTKIAASVIKQEGAEPVLKRWVGSRVKNDSKVRREMQEFFKKHGVKSVVATDRNMGCPHEEGEDFPVGEDCPFCPWWRGKQGSGRRE